jgi:lipoprotein NlpD
VGLCCLLLGACADSADGGPESYIVRPQDTLYSIAWRHDLDFRDLARWNNIGADFHISVGQVLVLDGPPRGAAIGAAASRPFAASRPVAAPSAPTAPTGSPVSPVSPGARSSDAPQVGKPLALPPSPSARAPAAAVAGAPTVRDVITKWVWPTERAAAPRSVPGGGILLAGKLGQEVRAASAGRVVYTGSGLRGYGNLIIIKHADSLLSAYAHNREMLVRDGQEVAAGQVIAHMGQGPQQLPVLYFEIRQNGKPIDPLPYLPR